MWEEETEQPTEYSAGRSRNYREEKKKGEMKEKLEFQCPGRHNIGKICSTWIIQANNILAWYNIRIRVSGAPSSYADSGDEFRPNTIGTPNTV
jgi:hypothetical protein